MSAPAPEIEEEQEVFLISTFIDVLKNQRIEVRGLFAFDTRCVFVHCFYPHAGLEILIYIPSRYEIRTEKNLGIPIYSLIEDEEEEVPVGDTLFVSNSQVNVQKMKTVRQKGLNRFVPIFAGSKYKIAYVDTYFVTFINRHNTLDGFSMSSPCPTKGYFLTIDLQTFYTLGAQLVEDAAVQQEMISKGVFGKLEAEFQKSKASLVKAEKMVAATNPKDSLEKYKSRAAKLKTLLSDPVKQPKAAELMNKIRLEHFSSMFEMENLAFILSELSE
jgi:hypothetical protein